jgi:hypothetical protein
VSLVISSERNFNDAVAEKLVFVVVVVIVVVVVVLLLLLLLLMLLLMSLLSSSSLLLFLLLLLLLLLLLNLSDKRLISYCTLESVAGTHGSVCDSLETALEKLV